MNTLVTISNNQPVVSSRSVAENFGKEHKNVLADIREILAAGNSATKLFFESTFENRGKQYPEYLMTRDGFTLLAMSFNGSKALAWKLKYIQAFNDMEQQLKNPFEIPKTFSEALLLAAEQQKTIELQQGEIQVSLRDLPKIQEISRCFTRQSISILKLKTGNATFGDTVEVLVIYKKRFLQLKTHVKTEVTHGRTCFIRSVGS